MNVKNNNQTRRAALLILFLAVFHHVTYAADYEGNILFRFADRCGGEQALFPYQLGANVPSSVCEPCVRKLIAEQNQPNRQLKAIPTCTTYNCSGCGNSWIFYTNYQTQDLGSPLVSNWSANLGGINVYQCNRGDTQISSQPFPNGTCRAVCNPPSVWNSATNTCAVLNKTPVDSCSPGSPLPIKYANGNKILTEQDYIFNANDSVSFIRHYSSQLKTGESLSKSWLANVHSQVVANATVSSIGSQVIVSRKDGVNLPFTYNGSNWVGDADMTDSLIELKDANGNRIGWTYQVDAIGKLENYNIQGLLTSVKNRDGNEQTITYSGTTRLISSISDHIGRTIKFSYDGLGRISTMTNPQGGVYRYTFSRDGNNNLISVTYPDNTTKTYHYEYSNESTLRKYSLTGITDENFSRYMTYTYDAFGRAIDEISPNAGTDVNHYSLVYTPGVSTKVTDPRGSVRTYNFTTILGVVKSTGQSQPAGSGCAASASAITYDANGNVASRTDFNGNMTTYSYDMARNLEIRRTEGLNTAGNATPATRTITTTWHPTWRLPLVTSEFSGATATGTALRRTTNVYDVKGNLTSTTEEDPVRSLTRTTTITYTYSSLVPGLVLSKVVNGPRTDATDTTTYNYYDANATCTPSSAAPLIDPITNTSPPNLGCRGQLQSMTNALGQTTTYNRYNHHGQVEEMTDANGLVTTNTYDLRQRLLSRTVGTETTSLTYDNAGQVIQLTMPDNNQLNYTYDAAHRLTEVQDTLGNKVTYTLDSEGNRINEVTTDPVGGLAKTITRSYDALNRLQQVTGVE